MKKQKKQNLLTAIIIILVLALIVLVGSMVYEELINMSKQPAKDVLQNTSGVQKEDENEELDSEETPIIEDENEEIKNEEEEYVGEEEKKPDEEDNTQSIEEKAIQLAKKEWGNDDTVIFSIVNKTGSKYRISVTKQATTLKWYEVDIETWEISEY